MDSIILICSTLQSKRLPQKAIKKIAGVPAIIHILNRLKNVNIPKVILIPWTDNNCTYTQLLEDYKMFYQVQVQQGNNASPLHRMADYINSLNDKPKYVVRITHDDILIDDKTLMGLEKLCLEEKAGYGISPDIIDGAGVEVIATENILYAAKKYTQPIEHVSYFVKSADCPNNKIVHYSPPPDISRNYRLTLDYPADSIVLEAVFNNFGNSINTSLEGICSYLDLNPHILNYNKLPKLTIYTCVYNGEKFIAETMRSVLNNQFKDFEYLIINDGSIDNTLSEILKTTDNRIRLINNESNIGLANSSNIAISEARGKYIMRVDADDKLYPDAINWMLSVANDKNLVAVYPNYDEIDCNDNVLNRNCSADVYHHAGCCLMLKSVLNELRFKENLRHWDSAELWNRLKNFNIGQVYESMFFYRKHDKNLSQSEPEERKKIYGDLIANQK